MHQGIPSQPNVDGGAFIKSMIGNAVFFTGVIANAWFQETKGEYLIPEEDYITLLDQFNFRLSKKLVPAKTKQDIMDEAKKFVSEIYTQAKEAQDAAGVATESGESTETGTSGEDAT